MLFQKLITVSAALVLASSTVAAKSRGAVGHSLKTIRKDRRRNLKKKDNHLVLKVTNQAYSQPFGGFFVMVHNEYAEPLFECGGAASEPLAILAENGDPSLLVEHYSNTSTTGVGYVGVHADGAPYFGGDNTYILVPDDHEFPYITIAAMAINTNDCFVTLNGVMMLPGSVITGPGYDAGSEENNESCDSIPGPACAADTGNVRSGNGEGFVHVHRGFFGVGGELGASTYDWRNPMMRVAIYEYDEETMDADGSMMSSGDEGAMMNSGDEGTMMDSGDEGTTVGGGDEGAMMDSGDEGAMVSGGGDEGATVSGGDEGAMTNSGDEGATVSGGDEGAAVSGGDEGATVSGGDEGATVSGGDEGATVSGGDEGAMMDSGDEGAMMDSGDVDMMQEGSADPDEVAEFENP